MPEQLGRRFELRKVNSQEWLVLDHRFGPNDFRRTVACLFENNAKEVEVTCLQDVPLALSYPSPSCVLEDVLTLHTKERAERSIAK